LIVNPVDNFLTPLTHSRRGKAREHGNELASFAYLFFFLFRNSCGGKKGIPIAEILLTFTDSKSIRLPLTQWPNV
jgi:hypothetical protein